MTIAGLLTGGAQKGLIRVISSVGLEHYLDRVGVTGSNPVLPTLFSFFLVNRADQGCEVVNRSLR